MAAFMGALAGLGTGRRADPARARPEFLAGLVAGFLLLFGERLVQHRTPHTSPWHCGIDGANTGIPYLGSLWMATGLLTIALCWIRGQTALPHLREGFGRTAIMATLGLCFRASSNHSQWLPIALSGGVFPSASSSSTDSSSTSIPPCSWRS